MFVEIKKYNNMSKDNEQLERSFKGKIDNFKDKYEKAFEKKRLKAYLGGHVRFRHGFRMNGYPKWFDVESGNELLNTI